MDTSADTLDQADEEILIPTVSDDALEGAAGTEGWAAITYTQIHFPGFACECD